MSRLLLTTVLILMPLCTLAQDAPPPPTVPNGGFEQVNEDGAPLEWKAMGPANWELGPDAARSGERGLMLKPSESQQWLRQELPGFPTRTYTVSGWFKALGLKRGPAKEAHARLYVHVLYQDRPYADGSQFYCDIPDGTYDWRLCAVQIVPNLSWPVAAFWVTVTSQFAEGRLMCDDISVEPAAPGSGACALDWENAMSAKVITDMGLCRPATALAERREVGKWKLLDYEIGPYTGRLLSADQDAGAAEVSLPLEAEGWHAVYVGLTEGKARLRLSSDLATVGRSKTAGQVEEVFLRAADLTGESLHIAQQSKGTGVKCGVAYVKLVPLTPAEVDRVLADRADLSTRTLATSIDGFSFLYSKGCTTREELLEETEEYRHSDFGILHVCVTGADQLNYPSELGCMLGVRDGEPIATFPRPGDRAYTEAVLEMARTGVNPTQVLIEGGKAVGMTVHVSIRPGAWEYGAPLEEFFTSPFYQDHPEWRCVDRDGTPVARMSFAVPQVRRHLVEVLREAVGFGADGANIIYVRGVPYVLWEEPFCRLFADRYGEDARQVPETDPRLTELRVEIMTGFMAEVRQMLDEEAVRRGDGKRLGLSAFVLADEADNLKYGIDVRGWVAQGLLDEISPYVRAGGGTAKDYDLDFFAEACNGSGVPWRPTLIAWQAPTPREMAQFALRCYDAGAAGITFWDGNSLTTSTPRWAVVSRLGHLEQTRSVADQGEPSSSTLRIHRMGEFVMDGRYGVMWGY